MPQLYHLPVAQLYFARPTPFNFALMVADISTIFDRIGPTPLRTTWDHDDLVFIDLGHLRILIGCGDDHGLGLGSYLTVALTQTSSSAGKDEALASPRLHAIAKLLVQSLSERLLPDSETWIKVNGPLTVDTMENRDMPRSW